MERIDLPDATAQPLAYREALVATLGDRDAISVMAATLDALPRLLDGLSDDDWRRRPEPEEWSPLEILSHFFDVDLVFGFRWRLTVTEDRPRYPGYDEKRFAALGRPSPPRLLAAWAGLREVNLAFLRGLAAEDFERWGVHGEQGEEQLRLAVDKFAGHDLAHVNQLERALPRR